MIDKDMATKNRNFPNIKSHILENDAIIFVNPNFVSVKMKIRIDRIISREIAALDDGASVGKIHKFLGVHKIGLRRTAKGVSVNLLGIEIVGFRARREELVFAIDSHMTVSCNFMPLRVITR